MSQPNDERNSLENISSSPISYDRPVGAGIIGAILGGLVAALIGGGIWGGIAIVTDYELSLIAIGVGFLAGFGVLLGSGRQRGMHFQLIAVAAALAGLVVGKYIIYYHFSKVAFVEDFGEAAWETLGLSPLSGDMIRYFFEDFSTLFAGMDILFIGVALLTAWSVTNDKQEQAE